MNMTEIAYALKMYYKKAEEAEKIILECAAIAAGASAIGGTISILALPAMVTSCFGAVWAMYIRLCKHFEIRINENVLKVLASAALSNIATNLISVFAIELLTVFVPGFGLAANSIVTFSCVYLAGMMFMKMLLTFAKNGRYGNGLENMPESELKDALKKITPSKNDIKNAKDEFTKNKLK